MQPRNMKTSHRRNDRQPRPKEDLPLAGKLMIKGVVTHDKLMTWIKERNPIIARARKDERRR